MKKTETFDRNQFGGRKKNPVSARPGVDGWVTTGLSFDDYARCQTTQRKTTGERRLPTPLWAMNNPLLRRVLVTFMEERAFSKKERATLRGGLKERLERAKAKIISKRPAAVLVMDRLCGEYVEIRQNGLNPNITDAEWNASKKQPYMNFAEGEARYQDEQKRLRQLEIEIEGIDTYLRISENGGADVVCGIVYLYYRVGMDSVGVGAELGLKSPHIRQTLWRLHQTAKKMQASQLLDTRAAEAKTRKAQTGKNKRAGKLVTPPLAF